ncbi:Uncharacterised protein [Klebsiella aerogenes]|nr:Uncharacterised protein [Klebsiella aerogenes]
MICEQPVNFAAMMALSPTAPQPNTTMDSPITGFRRLSTVPLPVWMPQPSGPSRVRSTSGSTTTALLARVTTYWLKDDWPKNRDRS